jgi:hypothetical protein
MLLADKVDFSVWPACDLLRGRVFIEPSSAVQIQLAVIPNEVDTLTLVIPGIDLDCCGA